MNILRNKLMVIKGERWGRYKCGMWGCHIHTAAAAAAAKSHQSCPTLCNPIDGSPLGSRLRDSPGKNTGVGCHFLLHIYTLLFSSGHVWM